jgi:hypothetical protein
MKPDPTFEHIERRRFIRRRITLFLALLFIGSGYMVLAIFPDTPMDKAIPRSFIGIGLLLVGLFLALLNRAAP